ncbi:hypothetical protein [Limnohabitans sp. B9-3]|uniref:hypothetical protein n=1 Tax=Limnohabitans sp. B9-3 TaxID=1100707 RepID=UPI000C1E893F|nr:hypothetical protein [Limnohabitans sp. B9-3]PIT72341.1 hypothetical protein B9Z42_12370 [Limnohabitans sp. B9-3]
MTSFVHLTYSTTHPGVARAERAIELGQSWVKRLQQESTYAVVLALFGALSLLASVYDIVENAEQGQELGAWVVLWAAVLMSMWGMAKYAVKAVRAWAQADREDRMWAYAMGDHRQMADLQWALGRNN